MKLNDIHSSTGNNTIIGPAKLLAHDIIRNNNDNDIYDSNIIDRIADATSNNYDSHGYHVSLNINAVINNQMIIGNHNNYIETNDNTDHDAIL